MRNFQEALVSWKGVFSWIFHHFLFQASGRKQIIPNWGKIVQICAQLPPSLPSKTPLAQCFPSLHETKLSTQSYQPPFSDTLTNITANYSRSDAFTAIPSQIVQPLGARCPCVSERQIEEEKETFRKRKCVVSVKGSFQSPGGSQGQQGLSYWMTRLNWRIILQFFFFRS